jgi:plastocyanin
MPHPRILAAVAGVALLGAACSGGREEAPRTQPPPDAKRVDPAAAGALSGRVTVDGPLPQNPPIKMGSDPVCARAHPGGSSFQTFVSEGGGLGNVFVYVKDGLSGYYFDTPSEPVKLNQQGCQFDPHVFGVRVGQNVEFLNSDSTMHNVHAMGNVNPEFNFSQVIQGQKDTRYFTKPEVMVRVKCDVHGWMASYAGVLDHPFFAVTTPGGNFELKGLPAGSYTVEAWHEKLGTRTQTVTLGANEKKTLAFAFTAAATLP